MGSKEMNWLLWMVDDAVASSLPTKPVTMSKVVHVSIE